MRNSYIVLMLSLLIGIILFYNKPLKGQQDLNISDYIGLFEEWQVPTDSSKPDQIRIDPFNEDIIWFTQPAIHGIAKFDYKTKTIKEYSTEGSYRPDGLCIDDTGVLWFGEQGAGTLGKFDPETEEFTHFRVPYKGANPALPTIDLKGRIWISDHSNDKVIRFDPNTSRFIAIEVPTPNSWVVDLKPDSKNRMWYSCYETDRLGVIDINKKLITEYELPHYGSGPAFLAIDSNDHIWFTCWKSNKIAKFEPETETFVEYIFPKSEIGPAALTISNEDVLYFSTKLLNAIVQFNPSVDENYFYAFKIPTYESGQKDGIALSKSGIVWFTEFEKNKIARLKILPGSDQMPGQYKKNVIMKPSNRVKIIKKVSLYREKEFFPIVYVRLK